MNQNTPKNILPIPQKCTYGALCSLCTLHLLLGEGSKTAKFVANTMCVPLISKFHFQPNSISYSHGILHHIAH